MLTAIDSRVHGTTELFMTILRSIIGDRRASMIDLCSHVAPLTRQLDFARRTYVDILPRDLGDEQPNFVQCDVLGDHESLRRNYDVSLCLDGIEHLAKPDGFRLLDRMDQLSDKQVVFTPLDEYCMNQDKGPEGHHSIWGPMDVQRYACLLMPQYHNSINIGAFFFWKCENIEAEFQRVVSEVNRSGLARFR